MESYLNSEGFDSCAPAHLKLAPSPTRSLLPSQFYLLCRFSQKLHSTCRFAHLCLARRSLGEVGSLASLRLRSRTGVATTGISISNEETNVISFLALQNLTNALTFKDEST